MIVDRLALIAAANRAPSVHNIQPARFRFEDDRTITLLEDRSRRLFVGDPEGKDNQKSLGAAMEGLALALSEQGLGLGIRMLGRKGEIARATIIPGARPDPLADCATTRATWRGAFAPKSAADRKALTRLSEACSDLAFVDDRDAIEEIARLFDRASLYVLRDPAYRAELLSWMRLSRRDPNYARDGLNAEAMALSEFEAFGAGVVLGPRLFPMLDALGVALPLVSEAGKVRSAAAVALFHRPADEPEFETGRRFYRVWLEVEHLGLSLCPMSVLADVPYAADRLLRDAKLEGRKLVTVFRIGRRPADAVPPPRARLRADELIVP